MTNTSRQLIGGTLGAVLISPFAVYGAGVAAKNQFFINFFGSDWTVFRSLIGAALMVGFAIGHQLAKQKNSAETENQKSEF